MKVPSVIKVFFNKWIARRHNVSPILLSHNTIYILPSKLGALFLCLTLVLFIVGVNYQNNLLLLSSYLFILLQIYAFFMSFKNLYRIELELIDIQSTFAPGKPIAKVKVSSIMPYRSLFVCLGNNTHRVDLVDEATFELIQLPYESRGKYTLPRFLIFSNYPLGLVKAFSYWQPPSSVYVYPPLSSKVKEFEFNQIQGLDLEYQGINSFTSSDNPVRMSWKHVARTGDLYIKRFEQPMFEQSDSEVYLNYNEEVGDKEQRLSSLATKLKIACENKQSVILYMPSCAAIKCTDHHAYRRAWETLSEY